MTITRLPAVLVVWSLGLISACEPAGVLVLDPVVEAAYGGREDVSRAARAAGSVSAPIRRVYLEQNNQSAEQSLADIIETYEGARVLLPALFSDLLEGIDDDDARSVVVVGSNMGDTRSGSVFFEDDAAVRQASEAIAAHVQRSVYSSNNVNAAFEGNSPEQNFLLVLADERSGTGLRRSDMLFESLERYAIPFEHVAIERYSSDPGLDELRHAITRFGGDPGLVVSMLPDFHGSVRNEAARAGAQFAALYPSIRSTRQKSKVDEEELEDAPVVQLVRNLEGALEAALTVDPGESRALELEVIHGL